MTVKVSPENCGHYIRHRYSWTGRDGIKYHEYVKAEDWGRKQASEALSTLENVYGVPRRTVRFVHV